MTSEAAGAGEAGAAVEEGTAVAEGAVEAAEEGKVRILVRQ